MRTLLDTDRRTLTIAPEGRFDFKVQKEFRAAYESLLPDLRTVVVDLSTVTYLDSSALGMLLVLKRSAEAKGGCVALHGARDGVRRILDVANFGSLFLTV